MRASFRTARPLRRAFSLIELMVVVVILGLLAAVVLVAVGGETDETRVTAAKQQVRQLFQAVQSYKMMCRQRNIRPELPDTLEGLLDGPPQWEGRWQPSLLGDSIPKDPWGNDFEYIIEDMDYGDFTIISFGRDGREGGEGYDADIRQSTLRNQ